MPEMPQLWNLQLGGRHQWRATALGQMPFVRREGRAEPARHPPLHRLQPPQDREDQHMTKMNLPPNWRVVRIEGNYALIVRVDGLTCYAPLTLYNIEIDSVR
jgi:hypothetical protein